MLNRISGKQKKIIATILNAKLQGKRIIIGILMPRTQNSRIQNAYFFYAVKEREVFFDKDHSDNYKVSSGEILITLKNL